MLQVIKLITSAFFISIITEVAKRNAGLAGLIAVMPVNIMISLLWIRYETKDIIVINQFIHASFRGIIPLACFLLVMYIAHKKSINFEVSFICAFIVLVISVYIQNRIIDIV